MQIFRYAVILLCVSGTFGFAQRSSTDPVFEGKILGGKAVLDQVIQTQLTLPKNLQNKNFKADFVCYFGLDSMGNARNFNFEGQLPPALKPEITRLFHFLRFQQSLNLPDEPNPYFLRFSLDYDKYKSYIKQNNRLSLRNPLMADSSFVVYSRADRSPVYHKNGDEGFQQYILSEIDYPSVAVERSIEGTVILEFVVETNGYISSIEAKKGVNGGCTEEAIRLLKSTFWNPAELNGKLVRYKMTSPITFSLRNVNKSNESSNSTFGQ